MKKSSLRILEMTIYSMLGTVVFSLQVVMEVFPNIHLTGMFVILYTSVFRKKALIPIYLYVMLLGIRWGFSLSWLPYLYIWLPLWGMTMLVPSHCNLKIRLFAYPLIGALHGFGFGLMYAPAQAFLFGFHWTQTLAWIAKGFPWDVIHGIGNLVICNLVVPFSALFLRLLRRTGIQP